MKVHFASVEFLQSATIWVAMSPAGVGPLCRSKVNAAVYHAI